MVMPYSIEPNTFRNTITLVVIYKSNIYIYVPVIIMPPKQNKNYGGVLKWGTPNHLKIDNCSMTPHITIQPMVSYSSPIQPL